MPIKMLSRYEISNEEYVLLVDLKGGCIEITQERGKITITLDEAVDLMEVLHRICEENS